MKTVVKCFYHATVSYFSTREKASSLREVRLVLLNTDVLNAVRRYYVSLADKETEQPKLFKGSTASLVTAASVSSLFSSAPKNSNEPERCGYCSKHFTFVTNINVACGHLLCDACAQQNNQEPCHICYKVNNTWINNCQPPGSMIASVCSKINLTDYNGDGSIRIRYHFPAGNYSVGIA